MAGTAGERVAILGDGQMGLVLAAVLAEGGTAEVRLWGHDELEIQPLAQSRRSPRLKGLELPGSVRVTADAAEALVGATMVVVATPTQFIRGVWGRVHAHVPPPTQAGVVSVAKGVENGTLLRPLQIVADTQRDDPDGPPRPLAVMSGPTIAAELARKLPAIMLVASDDNAFAERVQGLFAASWLRVYTSADPIGVEVAGATKNVIAIAAGVLDGLQAGYNVKSALLARGLAEITRLGVAMGATAETFFGLSGVGDLATTCFSPEGRNRSLGEELGKGRTLDQILDETDSVVEGVATTRSVMELAQKFRVEMPITAAVHAALYEGMDPIEGISRLMSREMKEERVG
jgi:glycerol-3-phosphate dehydrogenase (NAD(P)+)